MEPTLRRSVPPFPLTKVPEALYWLHSADAAQVFGENLQQTPHRPPRTKRPRTINDVFTAASYGK